MPVPVPVSADGGPPPEHGDHPPRGYRPPPPGYPYPPYGYPGSYGPPPPGYGPLPPGYPHHPPPSGYTPPGYVGRPMYCYGGYEGPPPPGYPMQHPRESRSKSPPFRGRGTQRRPSSQSRQSPVAGSDSAKSSPEQGLAVRESPDIRHPKLADDTETRKLREAALEEISPAEVAPIKTAFHFFVQDVRESIRQVSEEEVRMKNPGGSIDAYLVNSNMNCRLMKAWEELSIEERSNFMTKEEADRRRFMEEEEITSRHCATLTARSKSPKTPERRNCTPSASPTDIDVPPHSPISRLTVEQDSSNDADEKKTDDHRATMEPRTYDDQAERKGMVVDTGDGANNKRSSPKSEEEEGASPPKRNRIGTEGTEQVISTA